MDTLTSELTPLENKNFSKNEQAKGFFKEQKKGFTKFLTNLAVCVTLAHSIASVDNPVSAQTLDDDGDIVCQIWVEETGEPKFDPETGKQTHVGITNLFLECDENHLWFSRPTDEPIEFSFYRFGADYDPRDVFENFGEDIKNSNFELVEIDEFTGIESFNPNVNCHSFSLQLATALKGLQLPEFDDHDEWDDGPNLFSLLYMIGEEITEPNDYRVGDILSFQTTETTGIMHSGVIIGFYDDGLPIVRSKFGKAEVLGGSISDIKDYYKTDFVSRYRFREDIDLSTSETGSSILRPNRNSN